MIKSTLTLSCFVFLACSVKGQVFVTQNGGSTTKDGSSWATAYDNNQLQQAINEASTATIKQVWVGQGTFKPTENLSSSGRLSDESAATERDQAFILKQGVEIYGGFAGTETAIADRLKKADGTMQYSSVLSGDLNDNNTADNGDSYHVVASREKVEDAILDGFTIEGGYADGALSVIENGVAIRQDQGGAIATMGDNSGVTFRNLIIRNNYASWFGGAVYIELTGDDNTASFDNVQFLNNISDKRGGAIHAEVMSGAPILNIDNAVFTGSSGAGTTAGDGGGAIFYNGSGTAAMNLSNSTFDGNVHPQYGGALRLNGGIVNITSTVFRNGEGGARAGGIYSTSSTIVNISKSKFISNSSSAAAGHYYAFSGTLNVDNTLFENGTTGASNAGGAVYLSSTSSASFTKCIFKNNTSGSTGGAIHSVARALDIGNTKFYSNTANTTGGALYLTTAAEEDADIRIWNSVFYNNISRTESAAAASGGGAVYQTRPVQSDPDKHKPVSMVTAVNNTFYANKSINGNAAAWVFNSAADVRFNLYNNIFYQNLSSYDEATGTGEESDIRRATASQQNHRNNIFTSALTTAGSRTVANTYLLSDPAETLFYSLDPEDKGFLFPARPPASSEHGFGLDKGDKSLYTDNIADVNADKDLAGSSRLAGDEIDLGAYESSTELYEILPVVINSFDANASNGVVSLTWKTEAEDNLKGYEIERSVDGRIFVSVAKIAANGSSVYRTQDENPVMGDNFYRLKMTDLDGTSRYYGKTVKVKVNADSKSVNVFPNPVSANSLKVSLQGMGQGEYNYRLTNVSGAVVQQGKMNYTGGITTIPLNNSVVKGTYLLVITNNTESVKVRIVKQ